MVGGLQVAHQCRSIGRALKSSDFDTAHQASLILGRQTHALARELTTMLYHLSAGLELEPVAAVAIGDL
jgi:hypothetical protein